MRAASRFFHLMWPFFAAGFLYASLTSRERLAHVALRVSLDREHEMVTEDLHVRVRRDAGSCDVRAFRSGMDAAALALTTSCTGALDVTYRGGAIHVTRTQSSMLGQTPLRIATLLWLTFVMVTLLIARATLIAVRRDGLMRARPCVVRNGMATFVDGESPREAACIDGSPEGIAWACVRMVYGGTYRNSPYFPCEVLADRDEAISASHQDMLLVIVALACIAMSWLHFFHAWAT